MSEECRNELQLLSDLYLKHGKHGIERCLRSLEKGDLTDAKNDAAIAYQYLSVADNLNKDIELRETD